MLIDIVIPSHRNTVGLQKLLDSLSEAETQSLGAVVVVFNPPMPRFAARLSKEYSGKLPLRCLQLDIVGVNRARNLGAQKCKSDVILFLDDDEEIRDPKLLEKHLAFHRSHSEVQVLGGIYEISEKAKFWDKVYHAIQMKWFQDGFLLDGRHYHLLGGHLSCKRPLFHQFQFDESICFGGAETEFLFRLQRQGIHCGADSSLSVLHHSEMTFQKFIQKAIRQGKCHRRFDFSQNSQFPKKILPKSILSTPEPASIRWGIDLYQFVFNLVQAPGLKSEKNEKSISLLNQLQLKLKKTLFHLFLYFEFISERSLEEKGPHQDLES